MTSVLIIDDDQTIRLIANKALTKLAGWEVDEAPDGQAGIDRAKVAAPDLILLDVMMPGMDGPSTLAALQADPSTANIPVVLLTARASASDQGALEGIGAAAVLTKPFDPLTLHLDIAAALGRELP